MLRWLVLAVQLFVVTGLGEVCFVEMASSRTADPLPRNNTSQLILSARRSGTGPSDVTFAEWAAANQYQRFETAHFDWWMFPWYAQAHDSGMALTYSVLPGDVADLILSPADADGSSFMDRYIRSTNHLLDAKRMGGCDGVAGPSVHPARKFKIYGSLLYFGHVCGLLGLDEEAARCQELGRQFVELYPVGPGDGKHYQSHVILSPPETLTPGH